MYACVLDVKCSCDEIFCACMGTRMVWKAPGLEVVPTGARKTSKMDAEDWKSGSHVHVLSSIACSKNKNANITRPRQDPEVCYQCEAEQQRGARDVRKGEHPWLGFVSMHVSFTL